MTTPTVVVHRIRDPVRRVTYRSYPHPPLPHPMYLSVVDGEGKDGEGRGRVGGEYDYHSNIQLS